MFTAENDLEKFHQEKIYLSPRVYQKFFSSQYLVKIRDLSGDALNVARTEADIYKKLYGFGEAKISKDEKSIKVNMPCISKITLKKALHEFYLSQDDLLEMMITLVNSLTTLHSLNYVHGDIHWENVVLVGKKLSLIDFGNSRLKCNELIISDIKMLGELFLKIANSSHFRGTSEIFNKRKYESICHLVTDMKSTHLLSHEKLSLSLHEIENVLCDIFNARTYKSKQTITDSVAAYATSSANVMPCVLL